MEYYVTDKNGISYNLSDVLLKMKDRVIISLDEYKELLIIKGKYEELKSQQTVPILGTKITYRGADGKEIKDFENPYKVTCREL